MSAFRYIQLDSPQTDFNQIFVFTVTTLQTTEHNFI